MARTIKTWDRPACREFGDACKAALAKVAAEYGVTMTPGAGKFDATAFTPKFTFSAVTESATGKGVPADFVRNAPLVGLKPDDYGKTFRTGGGSYTVSGVKLSAPRFPILATREDGRVFKFPSETVKALLARVA